MRLALHRRPLQEPPGYVGEHVARCGLLLEVGVKFTHLPGEVPQVRVKWTKELEDVPKEPVHFAISRPKWNDHLEEAVTILSACIVHGPEYVGDIQLAESPLKGVKHGLVLCYGTIGYLAVVALDCPLSADVAMDIWLVAHREHDLRRCQALDLACEVVDRRNIRSRLCPVAGLIAKSKDPSSPHKVHCRVADGRSLPPVVPVEVNVAVPPVLKLVVPRRSPPHTCWRNKAGMHVGGKRLLGGSGDETQAGGGNALVAAWGEDAQAAGQGRMVRDVAAGTERRARAARLDHVTFLAMLAMRCVKHSVGGQAVVGLALVVLHRETALVTPPLLQDCGAVSLLAHGCATVANLNA
mmetsp:Transcript_39784/g.86824  ORF Transcript_39784/g.86824 Transcript_39784/m.86824 type:complete len:353 (-) Transcript_39784:1141-2199(-)